MFAMAEHYDSSTSVEYNNCCAEMKEVDLDCLLFLFSLEEDYRLTREWFEHHMELLLKSIFNVSNPSFKPKIVRLLVRRSFFMHSCTCIKA